VTPRVNSKIALRYTAGAHAPPATERHTASASPGQPAIAALTRNCSAIRIDASTLSTAVGHAARPRRALMPRAVSRVSSAGAHHATASA
jgi:hypothetical protein